MAVDRDSAIPDPDSPGDRNRSWYETAVRMYDRQHDRWGTWALFFFGSIASVFALASQVEALPRWIPCFVASLLSVMWVCVAIGIRGATEAWSKTVVSIEGGKCRDEGPFQQFEKRVRSHDYGADFLSTLKFWRGTTYRSVTRMVTWLGILAAVMFFVLGVGSIVLDIVRLKA